MLQELFEITPRRPSKERRHSRPALETLEVRLVPAIITWTGAQSNL